MTEELAKYVVAHYGYLMTTDEKIAFKHLSATMKATSGRSELDAQELARQNPIHHRLLSNDAQVMRLTRSGYDAFVQETAERIVRENGDKIRFNYCPSCGRLARTPKARQCRYCRHDWHEKHNK